MSGSPQKMAKQVLHALLLGALVVTLQEWENRSKENDGTPYARRPNIQAMPREQAPRARLPDTYITPRDHAPPPQIPAAKTLPPLDLPSVPVLTFPRDKRPAKGTISSGTAFLLHDSQLWMTARHVTNHCNEIFVPVKWPKAGRHYRYFGSDQSTLYLPLTQKNIRFDEHNDLSLFWRSQSTRSGIVFASNLHAPKAGERGLAAGYPQTKPGHAELRYLGKARARARDHIGRYESAVDLWSIESKTIPDYKFGGISGGPTFNAKGEVVGILQGSSINPRRARLVTVPHDTATRFTKHHQNRHRDTAEPPVYWQKGQSAQSFANQLRQNTQIVKIYCRS